MIHATIAGNIGKDAETKHIGSNVVTEFSVATDHWDTQKKERTTTWVRVSAWGERFAKLAPHLIKGQSVTVPGELVVREYEAKGEKRFSVDLRATDIKLMGGKKANGETRTESSVDEADMPF